MENIMADATTTETAAAAETSGDSAETTATATEATTETATEGAQSLGDAGKQALDRMKAERNQFRDDLKAIRDEFNSFKAKAEGKEAEFTAQQEAQRVKDEALAAADQRILKAEVRAAAASKLNDPQDALRFLDMSKFEVGSDGEVDASQVSQAIDDLIASKPYLAAQGGQRFQGSADGGARNGTAQPTQLSRADVERLAAEGKHAEIETARTEGRLNDVLGIKP